MALDDSLISHRLRNNAIAVFNGVFSTIAAINFLCRPPLFAPEEKKWRAFPVIQIYFFSSSCRTLSAESVTAVPGPKMPLTPLE